jgi:hypothetical protein
MANNDEELDSERARLDAKYKELTESRVASFVKEAGTTDAASELKDIFVSDLEKFKSNAHINKMTRLREYRNQLALGDRTRFGDGDGSWWDRWLTQKPPDVSSLRSGVTVPKCGFKRHHPKRFQIEDEKHDTPHDHLNAGVKDKNQNGNQKHEEKEDEEEIQTTKILINAMEGTERPRIHHRAFNTETAKDKAARFEELAKKSTERLLHRLRCDYSASDDGGGVK